MAKTIIEKLYLKADKPIVIINLPLDKADQFANLDFDTSMTEKIYSSAIYFAKNKAELAIFIDLLFENMTEDPVFWVAYPKKTAKIKTDLHRDCGWEEIVAKDFVPVSLIALDETWSLLRFRPKRKIKVLKREITGNPNLVIPEDFKAILAKCNLAQSFDNMSFTNKKEYLLYITEAKKDETRKNVSCL
jgi:hypothetical protein